MSSNSEKAKNLYDSSTRNLRRLDNLCDALCVASMVPGAVYTSKSIENIQIYSELSNIGLNRYSEYFLNQGLVFGGVALLSFGLFCLGLTLQGKINDRLLDWVSLRLDALEYRTNLKLDRLESKLKD